MVKKIAQIGDKFDSYTCISNEIIQKNESKNSKWPTIYQNFQCKCGIIKLLPTKQLRYNANCGKNNRCKSRASKDVFNNSIYVKEKFKLRREKGRIGLISGTFFSHIRQGASTRGIEFSITKEYIWGLFLIQKSKCALSGVEIVLTLERKKSDPNFDIITASLDRIDSNKGYIEGNVQWVHKIINTIKWTLNNEEFIKLCSLVVNNNSKVILDENSNIDKIKNIRYK